MFLPLHLCTIASVPHYKRTPYHLYSSPWYPLTIARATLHQGKSLLWSDKWDHSPGEQQPLKCGMWGGSPFTRAFPAPLDRRQMVSNAPQEGHSRGESPGALVDPEMWQLGTYSLNQTFSPWPLTRWGYASNTPLMKVVTKGRGTWLSPCGPPSPPFDVPSWPSPGPHPGELN